MKAVLLHADKKKAVTEEIKKQAKPSIVEALRRGMEEQRKKENPPIPSRILKQYFAVIRFCVIPFA